MSRNISVVTITRHGIDLAKTIKQKIQEAQIYAPLKYKDANSDIHWYSDQASAIVGSLFKGSEALICIFSLGAVIRLISPYLKDKKSDPAVLVIDDKANFVISALSGHLGGANMLAKTVASCFENAQAVITTAADVNETIPVDLVGREYGWEIENYENVTRVSAFMVNEEKMALYQDAGEKNWWPSEKLPKNLIEVQTLDQLRNSEFKGALVISDKIITDSITLEKAVVYRPKSLVVGLGLHWDTHKDVIYVGVQKVFQQNGLSFRSIRNVSSIDRGSELKGLRDFSTDYNIPIQLYQEQELGAIPVPNPSQVVRNFEGTPSVAEASALISSKGTLIVQKQKFPPNMTVAVARVIFD
jgi:cobalt-precorrin 5A hydrolase